MPSVGKMSRDIFCSANPAPSTTAITSTMIVIGRRNDNAARLMLPADLLIQLFQSLTNQGQHSLTLSGDPVIRSRPRPATRDFPALEPAIPQRPMQQRVQRPRADL